MLLPREAIATLTLKDGAIFEIKVESIDSEMSYYGADGAERKITITGLLLPPKSKSPCIPVKILPRIRNRTGAWTPGRSKV